MSLQARRAHNRIIIVVGDRSPCVTPPLWISLCITCGKLGWKSTFVTHYGPNVAVNFALGTIGIVGNKC